MLSLLALLYLKPGHTRAVSFWRLSLELGNRTEPALSIGARWEIIERERVRDNREIIER